METIKIILLFLYLVAIFIGIAGLTITILADHRSKTKLNKAMKFFTIGLVITNFYDFILYFNDYHLLGLPSNFAIRMGCSVIAILACLWVNLQFEIAGDSVLRFMRTTVLAYSLSYAVFWLLLALFFSHIDFHILRWVLLATDVVFILMITLISVVFMSKSVLKEQKQNVSYQLLVTAMIIWNYICFAWGETVNNMSGRSSSHIPLDMTIAFWFIVNVATVAFILRTSFAEAFGAKEPEPMEAESNVENEKERVFEDIQEEFALTDREIELCHFIYEGKTNSQIADALFITESTVKTHIYNLYKKTGVKSRMEIVKIVRDHQN